MQVLSDLGNPIEGGTLRRLLLFAALCMMAVAVFAPAALAQDVDCPQLTFAEAQAILAEDPSDPNGLDDDNDGTACDENAGDGSTASPTAEESASPAAEDVDCADFISAAGNPSQFQAQQFYDFEATPAQQADLDADGDGFACDDLETGVDELGETEDEGSATASATAEADDEESATATATADASALPDTGGGVSPAALSLVAALLLVGGGIVSASVIRRG